MEIEEIEEEKVPVSKVEGEVEDRNFMFVLNTNTSCFLCLKTNLTNYAGNGGDGGEEGGSEGLEGFPLLSICRYLGMSLKHFFRDSLAKGLLREDDLETEKVSNCSVTLCEGCASITSRLSGLCLELELLQMKVDYCLQSFLDELEDSEMDVVRIQKFRNKWRRESAEGDEGVHVNLAEVLRKEVKIKCDQRLNSIFPRVVLTGEQLETKKIAHFPVPAPVPTMMPIIPVTRPKHRPGRPRKEMMMPLLTKIGSDQDEDYFPNEEKAMPKLSPATAIEKFSNLSTLSNQKLEHNRSSHKKSQICTLCRPPVTFQAGGLQRHKVRHHKDIILAQWRLSHISPEDFKIYCEHVFKVESLSCRKGVNASGSPICYCLHCPNFYQSYECLQIHLFSRHKHAFTGKLKELQKSSTVAEISAIQLPTFKCLKSLACDQCGKTFAGNKNLKAHKLKYCAFRNKKMPGLGLSNFSINKCQVCGKEFKNKFNYNRHRRNVHPLPENFLLKGESSFVKKEQLLGTTEPEVDVVIENDEYEDDNYDRDSHQNLDLDLEEEEEQDFEGMEMEEYLDDPHHRVFDIERNKFIIKTENSNGVENVEAIVFPDFDPLQF